MQKDIKKIIESMDVKQDREDAESKALIIYKMGSDALELLVEMGKSVYRTEDNQEKLRKIHRAIIFTISIFLKKRSFLSLKNQSYSNAEDYLCSLSDKGYQSATMALHSIGFSTSDIQKALLLSLPVVDEHDHDRQISLNEALEEINISKSFSGEKGIMENHYLLGQDGKHIHEICRISNNMFAFRSKKIS